MKAVRCPFCSGMFEIPPAGPIPNRYCAQLEKRQSEASQKRTEFRHTETDPMKNKALAEDFLVRTVELIDPKYLAMARGKQVRFIALVGPTTAGKTVWMQTVGAHSLLPTPANPHIFPHFRTRFLTQVPPARDDRLASVFRLLLGVVPQRTRQNELAMSLPIRYECSPAIQRRGRRRRPFSQLGRIGRSNTARCLVLKDIAGEAFDLCDMPTLLTDDEKRHLAASEYYILVVDAKDDKSIRHSFDLCLSGFLENLPIYCKNKRIKRPKGAVFALMRCDERMSEGTDPIIAAMRRPPYRIRQDEAFDFNDYLEGMREVENAVETHLRHLAPQTLDTSKKFFRKLHFTAVSSLGMQTASVGAMPLPGSAASGGVLDFSAATGPSGEAANTSIVGEEMRCVAEIAMIRVMDPLLWIMHEEKML